MLVSIAYDNHFSERGGVSLKQRPKVICLRIVDLYRIDERATIGAYTLLESMANSLFSAKCILRDDDNCLQGTSDLYMTLKVTKV